MGALFGIGLPVVGFQIVGVMLDYFQHRANPSLYILDLIAARFGLNPL